uniref:Uncharacterized protein n=2 Tax=Phytophthora ramorum TaxID=164328 RepID=H3H2L8_PHYRM
MRERVGSGGSRTSDMDDLEDVLEVRMTGGSNGSSKMLLPLVSSRFQSADDDDNDKQGKKRRRRDWIKRLRGATLSCLLQRPGGARSVWKCALLLGLLAVLVIGGSTLMALEVVGRLRFSGYFVPPRAHNGQLGFYHEMDVDMQTLKDTTGRPDGKLFPASALNPREVKAWVAERRKRTNGRKFLVGCTSHWKGYVLRSFLSLFEELKGDHGWEDLDTSKNPMKVIYDLDRKRAPSAMIFCLNSFYYPMALLQEYNAYFHELRALGTIVAVWNDDLHYYDQFNPMTLRDEILTKVDVLVGTYTYFMDDYFAQVTDTVNERDLPLTLWLPHSSGPDFVNATFNEYPINKIVLSGKLGSNWYPLRHWLGIYQQDHRDIMDVYQHSGYYVADNQSAIYASYLRSYRTGITTTLIFQYVIAKIFEIPSTGALLAVNRDVAPLLAALGMNEGEHYIRVVRDLKDVPEGFEHLEEPLVSCSEDGEELRTYLCFRRLGSEDLSGSKWSILNQKAGNWIDVKDLSSNKWTVAQILHHSASEIRVHIPTWKKGRDEFLSRSTCRNRVAKLGTHTNVYMSPAYPFPRKQGSMWNANMKDLQQAREQFDKYFYDREKQKSYLPRLLIPFVEKSLLCTFLSSDLANEMNTFHQHVLKNVVACMLGNDADNVMVYMLSLLRMILNGHNSCMFFYIKYPGSYTAAKYQRLVYTSYLEAFASSFSVLPIQTLR